MTPRLPYDYARCSDGKDCPFKEVCKRWLTQNYDVGGHQMYSFGNFFEAMTTDETGEPVCEHRIVWTEIPLGPLAVDSEHDGRHVPPEVKVAIEQGGKIT